MATVVYDGVRYRSRGEADFAHWLDTQRIEYQYEPTAFVYWWYGKFRRYTPDFYVPDWGSYVEIKWELKRNPRKVKRKLRAVEESGHKIMLLERFDLDKLGVEKVA